MRCGILGRSVLGRGTGLGIAGAGLQGIDPILHENGGNDPYKNRQDQAQRGKIRGDPSGYGELVETLGALVDPVDGIEGHKHAQKQFGGGVAGRLIFDLVEIAGGAIDPDVIPDAEGEQQQKNMFDHAAVGTAGGNRVLGSVSAGGCGCITAGRGGAAAVRSAAGGAAGGGCGTGLHPGEETAIGINGPGSGAQQHHGDQRISDGVGEELLDEKAEPGSDEEQFPHQGKEQKHDAHGQAGSRNEPEFFGGFPQCRQGLRQKRNQQQSHHNEGGGPQQVDQAEGKAGVRGEEVSKFIEGDHAESDGEQNALFFHQQHRCEERIGRQEQNPPDDPGDRENIRVIHEPIAAEIHDFFQREKRGDGGSDPANETAGD